MSNSQQPQNSNSRANASGASKTEAPLSPSEVKITKQEFGDKWPFTVDEGVLACKGSGGIGEVTFRVEGRTYAVNGNAKATNNYLPLMEIWADAPSIPGAKKGNVMPIIERGLQLCQ